LKRYCGRDFSDEEMETIRGIIKDHPSANRSLLARLVCEQIDWRSLGGRLKEMSCRLAMLRMHRDGLLMLPAPQHGNGNRQIYRSRMDNTQLDLFTCVTDTDCLKAIHIEIVEGRKSSYLWNDYISKYHYLGYRPLPGAQLRYFAKADDGTMLALLGFGASAWKIAPRDKFIGWSTEQREKNLHLIVNNARYLILPWIRRKNLASQVLGMVVRRLANDWQQYYGYRPVLLETFIEIDRFSGVSYKAANWQCLGLTQGRGKLDVQMKAELPVKSIWVYPLVKNFRSFLCT
jgi:hypothetical protein